MNPTALLALIFALQAAGQQKPPSNPPQNQVQPPIQAPTSNKPIAPVSADLPYKFTAVAPTAGTPVAKVDGQPIYGRDVESLLWESLGPQMVEDVITLVTVRRAAAAEGIKVTQADIEKRLKEDLVIYEERTRTGEQARPQGVSPEEALAEKGYPMSRLYLNTEIEVTLDKMAEKTFNPAGYVKVSLMIFRAESASPAAEAVALKNAKDAVQKLKGGAKWETVITTSQLPAQYQKTGGMLGWLDYGTFPPDVLPQMKGLTAGQISQPIKVNSPNPQGGPSPAIFQIFRVEQIGSKAVGTDLDELKNRYVQGQHGALLKKMRDAAKVERFPAKEPSGAAPAH